MLTRPERNAQIIKDWSRSWAFFESFAIVRGFTLFLWWRDDKNISFYRKFVKPREFIKNLFVIFKFCEDKSNNVFREILKCFRKTAKFEFFAKQIIYLESPDHPLQNDIWYICVLRVKFFQTSKNGLNPITSRKLLRKSRDQNIVPILKMIRALG